VNISEFHCSGRIRSHIVLYYEVQSSHIVLYYKVQSSHIVLYYEVQSSHIVLYYEVQFSHIVLYYEVQSVILCKKCCLPAAVIIYINRKQSPFLEHLSSFHIIVICFLFILER